MNWYAYVGNDPVNGTDPSGLAVVSWRTCAAGGATGGPEQDVVVGDARIVIPAHLMKARGLLVTG